MKRNEAEDHSITDRFRSTPLTLSVAWIKHLLNAHKLKGNTFNCGFHPLATAFINPCSSTSHRIAHWQRIASNRWLRKCRMKSSVSFITFAVIHFRRWHPTNQVRNSLAFVVLPLRRYRCKWQFLLHKRAGWDIEWGTTTEANSFDCD